MPTSSTTPSTELEAVNLMLSTIGEAPISTLEQSGQVDAVIAAQVLREASADVQARGWHFNTDKAYPLKRRAAPDLDIPAPANAARIDPVGRDRDLDLTVRGGRLWDRRGHRFTFPERTDVLVDIVWILPFADAPHAARRLIAIRAARVFLDRVVGHATLHGFTAKDEERAERDLKKYEAKSADRSILNASHSVMRVLARRGGLR